VKGRIQVLILAALVAFSFNAWAKDEPSFEEWLKSQGGKEEPAKAAPKEPEKKKPVAKKPVPKPAPKPSKVKKQKPVASAPQPKIPAKAPEEKKPVAPEKVSPNKGPGATPVPPAPAKTKPKSGGEAKPAEKVPTEEKGGKAAGKPETPSTTESGGEVNKEAKPAAEEEGPKYGITGNWGGARDYFESKGISIKILYTGEGAYKVAGGATNLTPRQMYHDNLDITMKATPWSGGTFWLYGLRDHGPDPSAYMVGDLQTLSNIGTPDQFILNEAWFNQDSSDGKFSLLIGLHNLNSEFYDTTYGALFLNSSFGVGPELSHNVPVSIFPQAGFAIRGRVKPTDSTYFQEAIYEGDPTVRQALPSEGYLRIMETGYVTTGGDVKIGYWEHTADKLSSYNGKTYQGDFGYYAIMDYVLAQFNYQEGSSMNIFMEYGSVPAERNLVTGYWGGGFTFHALIPGRKDDDLGIAIANASTHLDNEKTIEVTYHLVLSDSVAIQPSYQMITNPGGDAKVPTATVFLLRFTLAF
jgi:porin